MRRRPRVALLTSLAVCGLVLPCGASAHSLSDVLNEVDSRAIGDQDDRRVLAGDLDDAFSELVAAVPPLSDEQRDALAAESRRVAAVEDPLDRTVDATALMMSGPSLLVTCRFRLLILVTHLKTLESERADEASLWIQVATTLVDRSLSDDLRSLEESRLVSLPPIVGLTCYEQSELDKPGSAATLARFMSRYGEAILTRVVVPLVRQFEGRGS